MSTEVMTPEQVQDWLQIGRTKLYTLIDQGLPYHSLSPAGRTKRFVRSEVQAWFDGRGTSRQSVQLEQGGASRKGRPPKSSATAEPRKWIRR